MPPLYDAHNHFQDDWLVPHLERVDSDLRAIGLQGAVVNGTCEADWPVVARLAARFPWVVPSFGVHPWDAGNRTDGWLDQLKAALAHGDRVLAERASSQASAPGAAPAALGCPRAAVGEIGLDRWILDRAKPDDPRLAGLRRAPLDEQLEVFRAQLALATAENRAASIHCLDAFGALRDALAGSPLPKRGFLLHAYGGPAELVKPFADLGACFSFNGSFLDPRHAAKQRVYREIPADRLLVETDAPAMRPPPAHEDFAPLPAPDGQPANHPANIAAIYAALAELRGEPPGKLAEQVDANFRRLFL